MVNYGATSEITEEERGEEHRVIRSPTSKDLRKHKNDTPSTPYHEASPEAGNPALHGRNTYAR